MSFEGFKQHVRAETCEDPEEVCPSGSFDDLLNSRLTQSTLLWNDSFPLFTSPKMASIDRMYSFTKREEIQSFKSAQHSYLEPKEYVVTGPPKIDFDVGEFGKDTGGVEFDGKKKNKIYQDNDIATERYLNSIDIFVSKEYKSLEKSLKQKANSVKLQNKRKQSLPKNLKTQEKDQQKKFEWLGLRDAKDEKKDKEKEVIEDTADKKGEVVSEAKNVKSLSKGDKYDNEKQLQHVAENGVKYYTDNRLLEEQREKEETISKQRLDPQFSSVYDSLESKSYKNSQHVDCGNKDDGGIETSDREATEDSWRDMESMKSTSPVTLVTSMVSMETQSSYDGSVLIPDKRMGLVSRYQSKEDSQLFVEYGSSKKGCSSECLMTETVRNKIDLCFNSHQEKTLDNKLKIEVLEEIETVTDNDITYTDDFDEEEEKYVYEESEKERDVEEKADEVDMDERNKEYEADKMEDEALGEECAVDHKKSVPICSDVEEKMEVSGLRKDVENRLIKAMDPMIKVLNLQEKLNQLQTYLNNLEKSVFNIQEDLHLEPEQPYTYPEKSEDLALVKQAKNRNPKSEVVFQREHFDLDTYCKVSKRIDKSCTNNSDMMRRKFWACKRWKPDSSMEKSDGIYIPIDQKQSRQWQGSKGHNYGRTCSNSGGKGGNYSGNSNGSDSNQRQSDRDDDNNNNKNSEGPNKNGGDGDKGQDGDNTSTLGNKPPNAAELPPNDYKHFRKKHSTLDIVMWTDFLGEFAFKTRDGVITQIDTAGVSSCVALSLSSPEDLTDEMMSCFVCISLSQFLKHYADCSSQFNTCTMCVQIFSLICSHVSDCGNNNSQCEISLCTNIQHIINGGDLSSHMKTLWFHVRKKLFRIIGNVDDVDIAGSDSGDSITSCSVRTGRLSSITRPPSLTSIPEDAETPVIKQGSSSRILSRKKSNLANVEEKTEPDSPKDDENIEPLITGGVVVKRKESSSVIYSRGEIIDDVITRNRFSDEFKRGRKNQGKYVSMPQDREAVFPGENYFPSMELGTTGIKGIGEVVYGDRHMLLVAARFWLNLKLKYKETGSLARHYREEGVILKEFEDLLIIQGIRYNCNFQWVKHNPLGNGMSGKCHLASDFDTNFKFCVKEIHISNYEMEEIELWCELDHPNIVKIYGAIRLQETIYILQEFIEGGNLTEAINSQKMLGRRLSQVTALTYFKQLLKVLIYLRSKGILHEDIKADNILLKQENGRVFIKVTDFGLARRCTHGIKIKANPAGTQTQWSPEKSEGQGYGYPAEVWAVVCVLVHMLSGYPPWIRRFENFKSLMFVIVTESPPVEDIPRNIEAEVRDMIERGFTVCPSTRPDPDKLLRHRAFRILDEAEHGNHTSIQYSVLPSDGQAANTSIDVNADLKEIIDKLNKNTNNIGKVPYLPEQKRTYQVYTVQEVQGGNSSQNQTGSQVQNEVTPTQGDAQTSHNMAVVQSRMIGLIDREYGHDGSVAEAAGGAPVAGINMGLMDLYLGDVDLAAIPAVRPQTMTYYNPEQVQAESAEQTQTTQTEEMIMQTILPDFKKLGLSEFQSDEDDESNENEDMFKDFDLEKEIPKLVQSFSQASLKSGSESPYQSSSEKSVVKEKTALDKSIVLDEQYNTIENEDELFISGPTQYTTNSHSNSASNTLKPIPSNPSLVNNSGAYNAQKTSHTNLQPFTSLQPTPSHGHHRSSLASQYQDYSLAPYLVPRDHPRHSTPIKTEIPKHSTPSPDSSGPHQPKRLRYDEQHRPSSGAKANSSNSNSWNSQNTNSPQANLPHANLQLEVPNLNVSHTNPTHAKTKAQDSRGRHEQLPYILDYSPNPGTKPQQLHIDVDKAQKGPQTPSTYAQTAPVVSPPSYPLQRMTSERAPPTHQLQQPQHHRTSSSTSTSQYDQQEAALRELNDALSQHSDHAHYYMMFNDDQEDPEYDDHDEIEVEKAAEYLSIAQYLGDSPSDNIKVTFVNKTLDKKLTVKFPMENKTTKMANIFEEELSRHTELFEDLDLVIVRYENGTTVDLDSCLGDTHMTLLIEEATKEDLWYMKNGMILSSSIGLSV